MENTSEHRKVNEGRRESDHRFQAIEFKQDKMNEMLEAVRVKIFNGYDYTIKHTQEIVDKLDVRNEKDHGNIIKALEKRNDKIDKFLWKVFGVIVLGIVASIVERFL